MQVNKHIEEMKKKIRQPVVNTMSDNSNNRFKRI